MRVCFTYGSQIQLRKDAELTEIRLDVFPSIPEGIRQEDVVLTLAGNDVSKIPAGFTGLVDAGESIPPKGFRTIRSFHNFVETPDHTQIARLLNDGEQDISKGAFSVSSFRDLHNIYLASKEVDRKHVILGMGDTGMVTRIRQRILGNEFTFGYVGQNTAPGQLDADTLLKLGDNCTIVGITGDPVTASKSPQMQNAAIKNENINAIYLRMGSPTLEKMRECIIEYDIRGLNVTIPHKQAALEQMDSVSKVAETVGAMNTVINDKGWLSGENTDVAGIMDMFRDSGIDGKSVLIMGTGGAARAAVYSFTELGCESHVIGRNPQHVDSLCRELGSEHANSSDASDYDIVVNCTPVGMYSDGRYPADVTHLRKEQIVFDMVYGKVTPLLSAASEAGCESYDGKDMLVGQGAASFKLWFGKEPDRKIMRGAL